MKSTRTRALAVSAAVIVGAGAAIALASTPALAAATCPQGHICFFENTNFTGSMSDQTNALIYGKGKIDVFWNSHYTNGDNLNDTVSSVVNNTQSCIGLNANFYQQEGRWYGEDPKADTGYIDIGPQTSVSFDGDARGRFNDLMSSTETNQCNVPAHQWRGQAVR
jgi:hypothetical protein